MSRYDMVIRGGATFNGCCPATSMGSAREKTEEIPETAVVSEDL